MSTLRVANLAPITGTSQGVHEGLTRAHATWSQIGTQTFHNSFNVSSLTDGGTGLSTLNFTAAMKAAAGYSFVTGLSDGGATTVMWDIYLTGTGRQATSIAFKACYNSATVDQTLGDHGQVSAAMMGFLA